MGKNSIEFIDVSKQYATECASGRWALEGIDISINQGEFVGLAGRNGSGKSTLARLMNGLIRPTTGRVLVDGWDTARRERLLDIRCRVGMVFQNPDNQIVSPIVEEDIAFGPENLDLPQAEVRERVDWALSVVGLEDLRHHAPHLLSGGQKQRVAIASALAMRPSYLVLDEPTSMLDLDSNREIINQLKLLNSRHGITVVLISHRMEDFINASRLIVLDEGKVCLDGTPQQIFTDPKLTACGLEPPEIVKLVANLKKRGHDIDDHIIEVDDLVDFICRS